MVKLREKKQSHKISAKVKINFTINWGNIIRLASMLILLRQTSNDLRKKKSI